MKPTVFGDLATSDRSVFSVVKRELRFSRAPSGFRSSFRSRRGLMLTEIVEIASNFQETSSAVHWPDTVEVVRVFGAPAGLSPHARDDNSGNVLVFRVCSWPQPQHRLGSYELSLIDADDAVIDTAFLTSRPSPGTFGIPSESSIPLRLSLACYFRSFVALRLLIAHVPARRLSGYSWRSNGEVGGVPHSLRPVRPGRPSPARVVVTRESE
jgi:hypothetical protein